MSLPPSLQQVEATGLLRALGLYEVDVPLGGYEIWGFPGDDARVLNVQIGWDVVTEYLVR